MQMYPSVNVREIIHLWPYTKENAMYILRNACLDLLGNNLSFHSYSIKWSSFI